MTRQPPAPHRKKVSRRSALGVLGAVATAGTLTPTLASCGSGSGSATDALTAWGTSGDQPLIDISVQAWNSAHADTPITGNYFGTNDYKNKIRTAISSSQAPTLIYTWGGGTMASYAGAGLIRDLTPDLEAHPEFVGRIVPSVLATGQTNGKTYAVPMTSTSPVLFYYNETVLGAAGVEQPQTWDDLLMAVPKIRAAGFQPIALGGGSKWPYLMWVEYLVDRIGGPEVFQNILDGADDAWSDPSVLRANTMIQELIEAGGFADGFATVAADTNADLAQVVTGRAAMLLQGAWAYSSIPEIDDRFESSGALGYGPFPSVEGGAGDPANIAGNPSSYWAVSAKASEEQAASAVEFLTGQLWTEEYTAAVTDAGDIPPLTDVEGQLNGDFATTLYRMIEGAPNFVQSWDLAMTPVASAEFWTQLDLLFNRSISPKDFSDAMNETLGK